MRKVNRSMDDYKDILYMSHHVSTSRPQMPIKDRAAQFAPFAAVVGHESAVKEEARYTDKKRMLDEMQKTLIDEKLNEIEVRLKEELMIHVVYFQADQAKKGGKYIEKDGFVKKIDRHTRIIIFVDGTSIDIEEIYDIDL